MVRQYGRVVSSNLDQSGDIYDRIDEPAQEQCIETHRVIVSSMWALVCPVSWRGCLYLFRRISVLWGRNHSSDLKEPENV